MSGLSYAVARPEVVARAIALFEAGTSIRAIVRETGASRNTVRRWVREHAAKQASGQETSS